MDPRGACVVVDVLGLGPTDWLTTPPTRADRRCGYYGGCQGHLRMAWNYLRTHPRDQALQLIRCVLGRGSAHYEARVTHTDRSTALRAVGGRMRQERAGTLQCAQPAPGAPPVQRDRHPLLCAHDRTGTHTHPHTPSLPPAHSLTHSLCACASAMRWPQALAQHPDETDFYAWLQHTLDLADPALVRRYYSAELLASNRARTT